MLTNTFLNLVSRYTSDKALANSLWLDLFSRYSEPGRYYHTITHLENMLAELNEVRHVAADWDTMLFALYYHDVVYNPARKNNEEESGRMAREKLAGIGYPDSRIEACTAMILATKHHELSEDHDTNLLCDADLGILGYSAADYAKYADDVRREYAIYPDFLYKPGRIKVLKQFLAMKSIFKTGHFIGKYEKSARINIQNEIAALD